MKFASILLSGLLGATAFAQDSAQSRNTYLSASVLFPQADLRQFLGGRSTGWGFEMGYDFKKPDELIGYGVFIGHIRSVGDPRADLATSLNFSAWRGGVDLHFNTPLKNLEVYAGLNANYFFGERTSTTTAGPLGKLGDSKAKFGARVGAEYRINECWGVTAEYDFAEWRSDSTSVRVSGYNPVNPSWLAVSVQYRF